MTPESMLQAIIERQCAGGHERYIWFTRNVHDGKWKIAGDAILILGEPEYGVIEILLDPSGIRAIYGSKVQNFFTYMKNSILTDHSVPKIYSFVAHRILDTWLETSSPEKTIETAYSLLPYNHS